MKNRDQIDWDDMIMMLKNLPVVGVQYGKDKSQLNNNETNQLNQIIEFVASRVSE